MEHITTIFDGIPKLTDEQIHSFKDSIDPIWHKDFRIQHLSLDTDIDKAHIEQYITSSYISDPTLKVINHTFLAIEGLRPGDEGNVDELIELIKKQNLSKHCIYISCPFTDWDLIEGFNQLVSLDLSHGRTNLKNKKENHLPWLKELRLDHLTIDTLDWLNASINNVESLTFEHTNDELLPEHINQFKNLLYLSLSSAKFSNIEELNLPKLTYLNTHSEVKLNKLTGLPNLVHLSGKLCTLEKQNQGPKLERIHFNGYSPYKLQLSKIYTENLAEISTWGVLDLNIDVFIPTLKSLHVRSRTDENTFKLSTLNWFPNLKHLDLLGTKVDIDIDGHWTHPSLKSLSVAASNLDTLSFLQSFPTLEHINAASNRISNLEPITQLKNLSYLNVGGNNIIDIPRDIAQKFLLNSEYRGYSNGDKTIEIGNNPLISPPIEIVERGQEAIKPYFDSMLGGTEELNEAKIVFLGNGEVGKTSLMRALNNEDFDSEEATTHGINIQKYTVPINEKYSVDASIWDFGGQQIMHATHQLFLSRRCVYVLVINDRKEDLHQEQKIDYWLQQVQTFGGNSKVIIIRNKADMFTFNNIPEGTLKEKYPNLVAIESFSCKTKENIKRVRDLINQQVRQLPMRKVRLAQNWIQVKDKIKALSHEKDHLPLSQFSDICNEHGVTDYEAQMTLRNLLHDLSVVIAFEELDGFDMGILSPHWITDGIYTLINSKLLEKTKGYIKLPAVQRELDKEYPGKYTNKARFIVESMIQFELCHPVGSSNSGTYLVPNLLPKEIKSKKIQLTGCTIRFTFKYENLLPPSIIPNLLVRMSHQIADDKRWRTGAIMTDSDLNVQAIVEEYTVERELRIVVSGQRARDYFAVIRHEIRKLNEPNTKALGVKELVPLNAESSEFVDYEELIGLEVMGKSTYTSGKLMDEFPVSQLLSGIESREETEYSVAKQREDIHVKVKVESAPINIHNTNTNNVSSEQSQVTTQHQQVEIKVDIKSLKGTADYVIDDLKADAEYEIVDEIDRDRFVRECNRVQNSISEIEQIDKDEDAETKTGHFMRVRDFLNNALDKVGPVGEAVESLGDNITKIRDMAKKYNKVASYFGLPIVPEILL